MRLNIDSQTIFVVVVVFSLFAFFFFGLDMAADDVSNEDYIGDTFSDLETVEYEGRDENDTDNQTKIINVTSSNMTIGDKMDVGPWTIGPWEIQEGIFKFYSFSWDDGWVQREWSVWPHMDIMEEHTMYEANTWDFEWTLPTWDFEFNFMIVLDNISPGIFGDYHLMQDRLTAEGTPWIFTTITAVFIIAFVMIIARILVIGF